MSKTPYVFDPLLYEQGKPNWLNPLQRRDQKRHREIMRKHRELHLANEKVAKMTKKIEPRDK